ncbi:hypothetical protein GCM10027346_39560 [Hymenobacter seoulensis]|uniref:DUF6577 family protein n=1 Tax=Hymenobacter sp. BT190 TaxID=2763505 RepID=UPI001650F377|nr:DUF6577 family protein [Hymenobacter sp. BT190]MBC6700228.1 hypothetical protein [Hymenobacter sp. BT190]
MQTKQSLPQYEQLLRAWPQLRGHFLGRAQVAEAELQAFFDRALPALTPEVWPTIRQGLVRSQLLHPVAPGLVAFGGAQAPAAFKPEVAPQHVALWQLLQERLVLPLGSLWSTQWLRPAMPEIPARLVVEVNWAEVQWATRLIRDSAEFQLTDESSPVDSDGREFVLLRPVQRASLVRRVGGVTTARLEKMLVDVAETPGLVPSDEALARAVAVLGIRYHLHTEQLLQYATRRNTGPRWQALLATAA